MNNNDAIRENILEYLYELNQNSRAPSAAAIGIKKLQSALKEKYSYKQQEVAANINYLIDRNWVNKEIKTKEFTAPGGTKLHPESTKYRISAVGIDYIEGPSKFKSEVSTSNINIHNISGVVTVGNSNTIINQKYENLFKKLDVLHRKALEKTNVSDEDKLNVASDIESLKNQLAKANPDKTIINKLWDGIKGTAAISECVQLVTTISTMIHSLF